jgi:hypothetical protein
MMIIALTCVLFGPRLTTSHTAVLRNAVTRSASRPLALAATILATSRSPEWHLRPNSASRAPSLPLQAVQLRVPGVTNTCSWFPEEKFASSCGSAWPRPPGGGVYANDATSSDRRNDGFIGCSDDYAQVTGNAAPQDKALRPPLKPRLRPAASQVPETGRSPARAHGQTHHHQHDQLRDGSPPRISRTVGYRRSRRQRRSTHPPPGLAAMTSPVQTTRTRR